LLSGSPGTFGSAPSSSIWSRPRRSGLALAERVYAAAYGGSVLTPDELRTLRARLEQR